MSDGGAPAAITGVLEASNAMMNNAPETGLFWKNTWPKDLKHASIKLTIPPLREAAIPSLGRVRQGDMRIGSFLRLGAFEVGFG